MFIMRLACLFKGHELKLIKRNVFETTYICRRCSKVEVDEE